MTTAPVPESELRELIEKLEAVAGKASAGEWSVDGFNLGGVISRAPGKTHVSDWEHLAVCHDENSNWRADAQFIALANPANILTLTAALRRSAAIAPTAVKALEWDDDNTARTRFGSSYSTHKRADGMYEAVGCGSFVAGPHETRDEAKAAAQADYEARILSALSPTAVADFIVLADDGERMTCKMPADETVVEVRLSDGTETRAFYSANNMEPGDFDFLPVDDDDEPVDAADSLLNRVIAWRPLASPTAEPAPMDEPVSPSDPRTIIAGIRQFGLAPDGSDLRDLEAALYRRPQPADGWREALEKIRDQDQHEVWAGDGSLSHKALGTFGRIAADALATPAREPDSGAVLDTGISDETKAALKAVDDNIRSAAAQMSRILVGVATPPASASTGEQGE